MVEDQEGNKYIVEIERSATPNFMHKACFNSSRIVVDSIGSGLDYTTIKKVFHISLLYFVPKEMQKPIYHGKTIVHEVDNHKPLDLRIANEGMVIFDSPNVFPEYFFISVPLFDDVIRAEIDEWLYLMKNSNTKSGSKSSYMKNVAERLSVVKMSTAERNEYIYYQKQAVHAQDVLQAAVSRGLEKGLEKGSAKKAIEIATNLIKQNLSDSVISSATGLSVAQIIALREKL